MMTNTRIIVYVYFENVLLETVLEKPADRLESLKTENGHFFFPLIAQQSFRAQTSKPIAFGSNGSRPVCMSPHTVYTIILKRFQNYAYTGFHL